ncbi:MAG: LLM class flavin-dependent oxidoreductase [Acidimicrobiales bacterium]
MTIKIGYLLPTRENVMRGEHGTKGLIDGARRANDLGFDSVWVGDSLIARPRHDPLTLLAGIAAAVPNIDIGTAVLLPALRNPVVLAQQLATIDQISEGRLIVGVGIAGDNPAIRAEFTAAGVPFDRRVGRLMEGVRLWRELWRGEPVDWHGRWRVENGTLAPVPFARPDRPDGPPIWLAAGVTAGIERAAKHFDGWFPIGPNAASFGEGNVHYRATAAAAGRTPTTALYLTIAIADDQAVGDQALDDYLESYYNAPGAVMRKIQACHAGSLDSVMGYLQTCLAAGAQHLVLRFVGDHNSSLKQVAARRAELSA